MGFAEAVRTCLGRYATFSGRAGRPEYWWFVLFVVLGTVVLSFVDVAIFGPGPHSTQIFAPLWQLALLVPLLAAGWRRLHDSGRPGWWLLIPAIVGVVSMLFLFTGVMAFGVAERAGANPDALRGPAGFLGGTGMVVTGIAQLVVGLLSLWWLTRPGDPGANEYGPPPGA